MVASVGFTVYTVNEMQMRSSRPDTDGVLVYVLTTGVIICIFIIFILVFIITNCLFLLGGSESFRGEGQRPLQLRWAL